MNNLKNESIKNDTGEIDIHEETRIVINVLQRLSECNLSKTEMKVYELALFTAKQTQKVDPFYRSFEINKTFIGAVLDIARTNASRCVKKLVEVELLKKNADGTYQACHF